MFTVKIRLLLLVLCYSFVSPAQIGFENNFVSNYNNIIYNPVGGKVQLVDFDGDSDLDAMLSFYNRVIS